MTMKCYCQNCGLHVEFDSAMIGQTVPCPNETCGLPVLLQLPEPPKTFRETKLQAVKQLATSDLSKLVSCADCAEVVSKRAHFCPHCGAPLPAKPGILDIVFKVAISAIVVSILIAVLLFLFGALLTGVAGGLLRH